MEISNVADFLIQIQDFISDDKKIAQEIKDKYQKSTLKSKKSISKSYDEFVANQQIHKIESYFNEDLRSDISVIQPSDINNDAKHYRIYYRGHYKSDFTLQPSVFRANNWNREGYFYHEIMVRCPERFQHLTRLDKLVLMQHYDCPTRLLDITSNPLVALFFACKNFGCENCSSSSEGFVYIFTKLADEVVYSDSDKALMLSCIARFSSNDKSKLVDLSLRHLSDNKFPQKSNARYADDIVERFYYDVTTEVPSFKREIKPIDLLQPLFVQPNKSNGRILKQDGAFILSGLSETAALAQEKLENISYKKIKISNQSGILKELEQIDIHEASLFPEVDKVANYLKGK